MRTLEEPSQDLRTRLTKLRLALLAVACLIAPAIRVAQQFHDPDTLVVVVASAALFLLVVARMAGFVRQEERAVSRELALREAGAELVAAASREQVHEAAISAVGELLGAETRARLVLFGEDGAATVSASTEGESWSVTRSLDPDELRFDGESVLHFPLSVRDGPRGVLAVG